MTARVLVVDDVPANVRLLEARLAAEYYDVASLCESRGALAFAIDWQPDAILLDIMMPDIDGIQLCRSLKAEPRTAHIPVIMVTALRGTPDRLQALAAGADEFLTKPIEHGILLARLRSVLRLKRLLDEWRARGLTARALGLAADALSGSGRVLVVDDLDVRAQRIRNILHRGAVTTCLARDEADALRAIENDSFDLLTINLGPYAGDPLRTIAKLRAADSTRDTPMLLIAEPDQRSMLIAGLDLGASDCLMMPLDETELSLRVGNHVRRKRYQDQLRQDVGHAIQLAAIDPLTGLYNRRTLVNHLARICEEPDAPDRPRHAILMIDIDHFKTINDRHGHATGDAVLAEIGHILRLNLRETDLIARYGGEEFVVVATLSSDERPEALAERLRDAVERASRAADLPVTVSIGVAASPDRDPASLMDTADRALYRAKRAGRNRVALAEAGDLVLVRPSAAPSHEAAPAFRPTAAFGT